MADGTKIEWTDATWTPVKGCTRASEGCRNCYAEMMTARFSGPGQWGEGLARIVETPAGKDHRWTGALRFDEHELLKPLSWRRPRMIFVCSTSDLFHEKVEDEWIDRVFAVMALAPQHTFQVLTKRAARMRDYLTADSGFGPWGRVEHRARQLASIPLGKTLDHLGGGALPNVWLGVSAEDQKRADERVPLLLDTPATVRWVSAEPMLGPIDFTAIEACRRGTLKGGDFQYPKRVDALTGWAGHYISGDPRGDHVFAPRSHRLDALDWIVVGGESGAGARPMHPDWARAIRDQCAAADVPFLFKQWGQWASKFVRASSGEMVFREFDTFQRWVDKAQTWVAGGICLDRDGRQLRIGSDFMRARDEGRFPATIMHALGKKAAGRVLDGVTHDAFPHAEEVRFG